MAQIDQGAAAPAGGSGSRIGRAARLVAALGLVLLASASQSAQFKQLGCFGLERRECDVQADRENRRRTLHTATAAGLAFALAGEGPHAGPQLDGMIYRSMPLWWRRAYGGEQPEQPEAETSSSAETGG